MNSVEQPLKGQIENLSAHLQELDEHAERFKEKSSLACIPGCGRCCLSNRVDAEPGEWLPFVLSLTSPEILEKIYLKACQNLSSPCIHYASHPDHPEKGSCSVYPYRPSICRLFGFSALKDKKGTPTLMACRPIKEHLEETGRKLSEEEILSAPLSQEYQMKISSVFANHSILGRKYPINEALAKAIEYVELKRRYGELNNRDSRNTPTEPAGSPDSPLPQSLS